MNRIICLFGFIWVCLSLGGQTMAATPNEDQTTHRLSLHLTGINDHAEVDTGLYPELRYEVQVNRWLGVEAGIRWGIPGAGNLLRYHLMTSFALQMPLTKRFALKMGLMHSTFTDIQRGENLLVFLNEIDTKHFYFQGGFAIRFPLLAADAQWNPFRFATQYVETTLLFDIRGKLEWSFPSLGGSTLQVGLGFMDFLPTDILTSNSFGYQLFGIWKQPKVGSFELSMGMFSYSYIDLAGFFGRLFVHLRYTYTFGG